MNILISGSSGYIGLNIKFYLLEIGFKVRELDRGYIIEDCLQNYDVFLYFSNPNEIVFNFNAKEASLKMVEHFYNTTLNLEKISLKHIVYASTVRVYDSKINPYANTHLYIENLLETFCYEKNILLTKARFCNVFGGNIKSMIQRNTLVPHTFIKNALEKQIIELKTDGEQKRDFMPMSLVLKYLDYILDCKPKTIDICSGHNFKIIEIIYLIQKIFPNVLLKIDPKSLNEKEIKYTSLIKCSRNYIEKEIKQVAYEWREFYAQM